MFSAKGQEVHDYYSVVTGGFILAFGVIGLALNSNIFVFFFRYVPENPFESYSTLKKIFLNLSFIDTLLSLSACFVRGPGYIWPHEIYGATENGTASLQCKVLSVGAVWFLSNQNLYGILPFSLICAFGVKDKHLWVLFISCWAVPLLEIIVIVVALNTNSLDLFYSDTYRRCILDGDWAKAVDYLNLALFGILPLLVHVTVLTKLFWGCRCQCHARVKTGLLVIIPFIITWLPYLILYQGMDKAGQEYTLIYIFFYFSIVYNPIIYGYWKYGLQIFKEGCCKECCYEVKEEPSSITPVHIDQVSSLTDGDTDRMERSRPQPAQGGKVDVMERLSEMT